MWALWRWRNGELGVGPIGYVPSDVAAALAQLSKDRDIAASLVTLREATERGPAEAYIAVGWRVRTPDSKAKPGHRAPVMPSGCLVCSSCNRAIEGAGSRCDLCGAPL